jgi:hypothetical protein
MSDPRGSGKRTTFIPLPVAKEPPPASPRPAPAAAPQPTPTPTPPEGARDPFAGLHHDQRTTEFRARHPGPSLALFVGMALVLVIALAALLAAVVLVGIVAW